MERHIASNATAVKRKDLHQTVTDTIIARLEAGTVPWHQPWLGDAGLPRNAATGKTYRGVNILLLWGSSLKRGFETQEWATFKQWRDKGQMIRKGEKGSLIVYYDVLEKEVDGEVKEFPFLKSSHVFNRCQLADYQPLETLPSRNGAEVFERIFHVDDFVRNTKAVIVHTGPKACYIPSLDKIWLPRREDFIGSESCTAAEGYYSTLLHELTHWTGHAKRRNRVKGKSFGDNAYAVEELVAELGAAFLCAEFGIALLPKGDHASYIAHWLQILRNDKRCLFTAAGEASKAVDFLHGLQPT